MTTELVAVLVALGAFAGVFVAVIQGAYTRRKTQADAEAQRIANTLAPLQAVIASLQQQHSHVLTELERVRESNRETHKELDQAFDRIAILATENHAWGDYHFAMVEYQRRITERMRAAGLDMEEPPPPPEVRTTFTRRTDARRGDSNA